MKHPLPTQTFAESMKGIFHPQAVFFGNWKFWSEAEHAERAAL
jgi:hypothetical protein